VAVYEGKLIENLHVENAKRMVALAEAIAARDGNGGEAAPEKSAAAKAS
jgi:hypothetical protein